MSSHTERTLIIIKPDALQRSLVANIVQRFERKGLKLVGMKMMSIGDALVKQHYSHHVEKPFFADLKNFMQSTPVIVMAWQGIEVVQIARQLIGATSGRQADIGTIRGDLSNSTSRNIVHGSDSVENAAKEVKRFFQDAELFDWNKTEQVHIYAPDE